MIKPSFIFAGVLFFFSLIFLPSVQTEPNKQVFGVIDDSYEVNAAGAYNHIVPIRVPSGVNGLQPNLALVYDSRSGVSELGLGWALTGISKISRSGNNIAQHGRVSGINFTGQDSFLLDGQYLSCIEGCGTRETQFSSASNARYRTENESFSIIRSTERLIGTESSPKSFVVKNANGLTHFFGTSEDSRRKLNFSSGRSEVLDWYISRVQDTFGNYIDFIYEPSADNSIRIASIKYTGNSSENISPQSQVFFEYFDTSTVQGTTNFAYLSGVPIENNNRLKKISISTNGDSKRKYYHLIYDKNKLKLEAIKESPDQDGKSSLPATQIHWQSVDSINYTTATSIPIPKASLGFVKVKSSANPSSYVSDERYHDFDNDGDDDLIIFQGIYKPDRSFKVASFIYENRGNKYEAVEEFELDNLRIDNFVKDDQRLKNIVSADVNGDLISDFISENYSLISQSGKGKISFSKIRTNSPMIPRLDQRNPLFPGSIPILPWSYFPAIVDLTKLETLTVKVNTDGDNRDELLVIPQIKFTPSILEDRNLLRSYHFRNNEFVGGSGPETPATVIKKSDLNSDGIDELVFLAEKKLLFTSNDERNFLREWEYPSSNITPNFLDFADFNGDGYDDLYYKQSAHKIKVWLNDGLKLSKEHIELDLVPEDKKRVINFGNFTNSGHLQAIEVEVDNRFRVYDLVVFRKRLSTSEVKDAIDLVEVTSTILELPTDLKPRFFSLFENAQIDFQDVNYDGVLEIVEDSDKGRVAYSSQAPVQHKVVGVTDGFGNRVRIEYAGLKDPKVYNYTNRPLTTDYRYFWGSYPVVKSVKYSNGVKDSGTNSIDYTYSDLVVQSTGRGLSGFRTTSMVDNSNGIRREVEYIYDFPLTGKILSEKRTTKSGIVFFEQNNKWKVKAFFEGIDQDAETIYRPSISREVSERLNLSFSKANKLVVKDETLQNIGNLAAKMLNRNLPVNFEIINKDNPNLSARNKIDHPNSVYKAIADFNRSRITYLPVLTDSKVVKRELDNKVTSSSSIRYEFDASGNIRQTETEFSDGSKVINERDFINRKDDLSDNGIYLIGLPKSEKTTAVGPDGIRSEARTIDNEFNPNGSLKKKIRQKAHSSLSLTTEYSYDGFGNIIETRLYRDSNNVNSDKTVFTEDGRFPKERINTLNFKTTFEFDKFYGNLLEETDPNGFALIRKYDEFGILTNEIFPDKREIQYDFSFLGENNRENALYQLKINQSGAEEVVQYYDKMGREIGSVYSSIDLPQSKTGFVQAGNRRRQVDKAFERKVESQVWFDSRGNVVTAMKPRYFQSVKVETQGIFTPDGLRQCTSLESSDNYFAKFEHDDFDRVTKSVLPDGKFAETRYVANKTTEFDLQGKTKTTIYNQKREIIKVVDEKKNAITYEYDLWGNVTKINSPDGTSIQTEFDGLGRKIKLIDPNIGTVEYQYDEFDRLIKETTTGSNEQKKSVSLEYDKLSRLTKKTSEEGDSVWTYDKEKKGRVSETIDTNGNKKQLKYDDLARPVSIIHTINDNPYETNFTYDGLSRIETKTFNSEFSPETRRFNSAYTIGYEYVNNVPVGVSEIKKDGDQVTKKTLARINSLTADGLIVNKTYGNGLVSNYKYKPENNLLENIETQKGNPEPFQPVETSCPLPLTQEQIGDLQFNRIIIPNSPGIKPHNPGWTDPVKDPLRFNQYLRGKFDEIKGISSANKDAPTINPKIQDLKFEYDDGYNVVSKTDLINKKVEGYFYDKLDRLSQTTTHEGESKKILNLKYDDETGNILSKSDTGTFEYDAKSPQRVKFISKSGNLEHKFSYDNFGNLIEDSVEKLQIKYSTFNKPTEISKNELVQKVKYGLENEEIQTTLTENAIGNRISLKPFQDFEIITEKGVQTTLHYISLGGELVAIHNKTNQSSFSRYVHKDRLGSIQAITDERGDKVAEFDYSSFGERETKKVGNPTESQASRSRKGFTSHEHLDEFGLINASGRHYMPQIGRFVSADPFIQSPSDLQSLNRYSYVENDPLNSVDPSGYFRLRGPKVGKVKDWGRNIGREASRGINNTGRTIGTAGQQSIDVHRNAYNEGDRFADKYGEQIVIFAAAVAITAASGGTGAGVAFALVGKAALLGAATSVAINAAVITYHGGNFQDIMNSSMNAAVNGAASAAAFNAAGSGLDALNAGYLGRVGTHAAVGGVTNEVAGGNFKDGMISASISTAFSPVIEHQFGTPTDYPQYKFHRIAAAGAIGGTAAHYSGGNVLMGTTTGVFSRWFNHEYEHLLTKEPKPQNVCRETKDNMPAIRSSHQGLSRDEQGNFYYNGQPYSGKVHVNEWLKRELIEEAIDRVTRRTGLGLLLYPEPIHE